MMSPIKFSFASHVESRIIEKPRLRLEITGDVIEKMQKSEAFNHLVQEILGGVDEFMKFNDIKMDATLEFLQDPEWTKWVNLRLGVNIYINDFDKRRNVIRNLGSFIYSRIKGRDEMEQYFFNIEGSFWVVDRRFD